MQLCAFGRCSKSLLCNSPRDLLADDCTAMSHGGHTPRWMRRFGAQPPQRRWADRGFPWSGDGGGPLGEQGHWSARICSFGVALQRRHRVLEVDRGGAKCVNVNTTDATTGAT